jgi:foldase protein PrsA
MKKGKIILGVAITLCAVLCLTGCKTKLKNGKEVAIKVNGENITADDLYDKLREKYAKYLIVEEIDKTIFNEIYKDDKDIEEQVKNQYEYYESQYGSESQSFEEVLKDYGYKNANEFKEELRLSFQRSKAVDDYIKDNLTNKEIQKYYDEEYSAEISAKHILISVTDEVSEDEALEKAKDLINQLNDGADFATLAKENSDDSGSASNGGDLGYFGKGQMVSEFEEAAFALNVDEYTKEPVKTTYGYHIILKTGEKDKKELKDVKDEIKEKILEKKKEEDSNISEKTLDKIRKNYGLKFKDSKLKSIYKEYLKEATEEDEE